MTDQEIYTDIILDLNAKADARFRPKTKSYHQAISARLKEGFTIDDFKYVHTVKCEEWIGTKFEKYLCPDTLYRPSNFQKYLNQKLKTKVSGLSEAGQNTLKAGMEAIALLNKDKNGTTKFITD